MRASFTGQKSFAYVLTESDLRKIYGLLEAQQLEPRIAVQCGPKIELHPENLDELFSLTNAGQRKITKLTFSEGYRAHGWDLELEFSESRYIPIAFDLEGEDDRATLLEKKINEVIDSTRQPYSALVIASGLTPILTFVSIPLWIVCMVLSIRGLYRPMSDVGALVFLLLQSRSYIVKYFYPVALFEIGKGVEERARFEKRRTTVGYGIIGATVIGLLVNALSHMLHL